MKAVIVFAISIVVMISAGIGCLMIFEVISLAEGGDLILRSVLATGLLGAASVVLVVLSKMLGGEVPETAAPESGLSCK